MKQEVFLDDSRRDYGTIAMKELEFSETSKKKRSASPAPWYYLGLIGEIGFAIAIPIAGGGLLGVVIDKAWSSTPKATLSLLFLGVVISFMNMFNIATMISGKNKK